MQIESLSENTVLFLLALFYDENKPYVSPALYRDTYRAFCTYQNEALAVDVPDEGQEGTLKAIKALSQALSVQIDLALFFRQKHPCDFPTVAPLLRTRALSRCVPSPWRN